MTLEAKFREPNLQFASSGDRNEPDAKFRESNLHFMSSGTGLTQYDKFEGRWCTLLLYKISIFRHNC